MLRVRVDGTKEEIKQFLKGERRDKLKDIISVSEFYQKESSPKHYLVYMKMKEKRVEDRKRKKQN